MHSPNPNVWTFYSIGFDYASLWTSAYEPSDLWPVMRAELADWLEMPIGAIECQSVLLPDLGEYDIVTVGGTPAGTINRPLNRDELRAILSQLHQ